MIINRATGEGYVEFGNESDASAALDYHKRNIGTRYVEVFKCPKAEMERVLNPPGHSAMGGGDDGGGGGSGSGGGGGVCFSLVVLFRY
jgi:hypothetical protein